MPPAPQPTSSAPAVAPELMAPAGDFDAMKAAVANGANAVYFGLSAFNARHRATNFTLQQLPEVMAYLHAHNVKGYITFNTLIFSDELEQAAEFTKAIAAAGADAVIVQDLGLARLIHRLAPGLHIHGSTQMTLTEPRGIEFVRALGVDRVVLARELSVPEIQKIRAGTDMPVEVFVHGALCVAYSGQCLTSESLGGRSANRGQCAQACRLPYDLIVDGAQHDLGDRAYLLSPQDLAAHDLIDPLVKLGVSSFKIEGRLKSAHYVAATTQTYRAALDASLAHQPFRATQQQQLDLAQSFSRGFTHGFLDGVNHQTLVPARFPKSRGVRVGTVTALSDHSVTVSLDPHHPATILKPGDGVVFDEGHPEQDEQGGRIYEIRMKDEGGRMKPIRNPQSAVRNLELSFATGAVNFRALTPGAIVWKTDDPAIRKRLEQSFNRDTVQRRTPLDVRVHARVNQPLTLEVSDDAGRAVSVQWDKPLELAQKFPFTLDLLRDQFSRLGNTPFELRHTRTADDKPLPPVMVPKSVLNDLRRQAVDQLLALRAEDKHIPIADPDALEHLRSEIADPDFVAEGPLNLGMSGADCVVESCSDTGDESAIGNPKSAIAQPQSAIPSNPKSAIQNPKSSIHLYPLARTLDQLAHVLSWSPPPGLAFPMVYCDFEDVRRYKQAVELARHHNKPIALATLRVIKPHEHGLLKQIADTRPDAILVRNLAALSFYSDYFRSGSTPDASTPFEKLPAERESEPANRRAGEPAKDSVAVSPTRPFAHSIPPLIADHTLNIANELTAQLLREHNVRRMVPSYDLNFTQLRSMLSRIDPALFELTVHQHMPMFHMEHCVFAATLSTGTSYIDCGRPCESHTVNLRDREGVEHPLIPDVGCRNTVYNGTAQSAAELIPDLLAMGLQHFRVELLREQTEHEVHSLLTRYARVLTGLDTGRQVWRQLKILNQLGVTRGTLEAE